MNTQTLETRIKKQHNGWQAVTFVRINDDKSLRISTYKSSNGLRTSASAVEISGNTMTTVIGNDFYKNVMPDQKIRCTRHAIEKQHQQVLDVHLTGLLSEAVRHYQ